MKKRTYAAIAAAAMLTLSYGIASAADYNMSEVVVEGARDGVAPLAGDNVNVAYGAGIRGTQSLHETPFTVTSFTEKTIKDYSDPTQPLPSVLVNNPSVRTTATTFYDDFSIRGIKLNGYQVYLNGVPGLFGQGTTPTNYISRVDVTSGPALATNQATASESAGGLVNLVSKQAEAKPNTDVTLGFSGRGTYTQQVDVGRRFGENNEWGLRVNALNSDGETSIPDEKRTSRNIFVNLDHKDDKSSTNFLVGYIDDSMKDSLRWFTFDKGLTYVPSAPDIHKNYGFKAHVWEADKWIATLNHEQKLSKNWSAFLNAGYGKYDIYNASNSDWRYTIKEDGSFSDSVVRNPFGYETKTFQIGIKGKVVKGDMTHNLVFAADKYWQKYFGSTYFTFGDVSGNLNDGITSQPEFVPAYPYPKPYLKAKTIYTSWKMMDTMEIGKWNILAGIMKQEVSNNTIGGSTVNSSAVSPLYGIVYKPNDELSFYASHSESFGKGSYISGSQYLNAGDILDPAKTKQNEVGVRYNNGKILTTLAGFEITTEKAMDMPTADPNKFWKTNNGEVKYRGFDWSVYGKLSDKWNIMGGLMYVDAKIQKSTGGTYDGIRQSGVPKWSGVVGLEYAANDSFSVLARGVYSGSYTIMNEEYKLPSYMTYDLGVKYKTTLGHTPVALSAMVYNLFDKAYWESLPGGDNLILSMPRTFMLSATFSM